jgi:ribonuclease PH
VQVIATVLSINPEIDSDIPAMIGASAAVTLSGIPFEGPIGAARVGYIDGEYVINPTKTELEGSKLNLVVAGTEQAVLMVESEANELSEEVMLGAVVFGHEQMQAAINAINELADEGGKDDWDWEAAGADPVLVEKLRALVEGDYNDAYRMKSKSLRSTRLDEIKKKAWDACVLVEDNPADANVVRGILKDMESKIVRGQILNGEPRIDGRNTRTVRPISIRPTILPRVHGSVLFTRGETQAIVTTTLGTGPGRAAHRRAPGRVHRALHAALQLPAVLHRRDRPRGLAQAPRDRPRPPRQARAARGAALEGGVRLHAARGLGDHRVERLVVDGLGLRRLPRADGRRRAPQGPRRGHRDGPHQGRRALRGAHRHPRRRGPPRRHGLQGGRHRPRHHRAADGHQDQRHHQGDHEGRARPGQGRPHAHPRAS